MKKILFLSAAFSALMFFSCYKGGDYTLEEIEQLIEANKSDILKNSISKPYNNELYEDGVVKGIWNDTILSDPKTFNQLIAERDGESNAIIAHTLDYLADYNPNTRQWTGHIANFKIETDKKNNTLTVHYAIRDDAFWTYYGKSEKIPVTSDDFVFWYNEIAGDPDFGSSGYGSQFVTLENGEQERVQCIKIDDKHFDFVFPRIVAEPVLATNMNLCPSFIYRPAKEQGGVEGVKNLFSINCDLRTIPSCGMFHLVEYIPGRRIVFARNPDYWDKDKNGNSIPYYEQKILQIVGDQNTDFLLFKQGKVENYSPRPEDVSELINNQNGNYTVFNAEGSSGAVMWSFNQNPVNADKPFYDWFTKKEFRQAMSCVLNRDRIIAQAYRGLAEPKYSFFPEVNPYFNPDIELAYKFDLKKAEELLQKCGFTKGSDGYFYDSNKNLIEYDLTIASSNTVMNDIGQILVDEASKIGVKINIRQTDFQKIVEMLTATYDWQAIFIGLGSNLFPSQGSNVWPSYGNLHLWYPLQEKPATDWEARIDYLYNEGCYTIEKNEAKKIWDEYQSILLEQCPVIYLMRSRSFYAISNRWNLNNLYFDNKNGVLNEHVYLRD